MLIFFTVISIALVLLIVPVWFAQAIEGLNKTNSKLVYIPIINECRAEYIYYNKIGPVLISWILLPLSVAGWYFSYMYMHGSILQIILRYVMFVAVAFWFLAKTIDCVIILRELAAAGLFMIILSSIIYPIGYSLIKTSSKVFKGISS